jgi:hypothetical protein
MQLYTGLVQGINNNNKRSIHFACSKSRGNSKYSIVWEFKIVHKGQESINYSRLWLNRMKTSHSILSHHYILPIIFTMILTKDISIKIST